MSRNRQMVTGRSGRDPILANVWPLTEWVSDRRPELVRVERITAEEQVRIALEVVEVRKRPPARARHMAGSYSACVWEARIPGLISWTGGRNKDKALSALLFRLGRKLGMASPHGFSALGMQVLASRRAENNAAQCRKRRERQGKACD